MKKSFIKSALVAIAIMLVSVCSFAVDFSASTYLTADLWGTNGFVLNNTTQKDSDLLTVSVGEEQWGSYFRFYTNAQESEVYARSISIWVKPLSMLKITVGNIGSGLYTEQLDWWQVPTGAPYSCLSSWASAPWSSDAATSGAGVNFELTPVDGLWILAGISPGFAAAFMDNNAGTLEAGANTKFGVALKYSINGFGSVGAAYRNNGDGADQSFRVGMDINAVSGLYAILQAICRIDAGATELSAVAIDNYISFSSGNFYVKTADPVTLRLTGAAGDSSFMCYDVKAGYTVMPNMTPFVRVNGDINFDAVAFAPTVQLGADYSLAKVSFSTALQLNIPAAGDITWSLPFSMRASW